VTLVDTSRREPYARIGGLGDLSHASVVYRAMAATLTSSGATAD
jgi:hypothetical protein